MSPLVALWVIALVIGFWLLVVRPQRNARQRASTLARSLEPGDRVVTIGGLYGTIAALDSETVDLEVAEGVVMTFARRAIAGKAPGAVAEAEHVEDEEDEDAAYEEEDDEDDEYDADDEHAGEHAPAAELPEADEPAHADAEPADEPARRRG